MPNEVCVCIKKDEHGESACKDATSDPAVWGFVCKNECVVALTKKLESEKTARTEAEAKLKKYRNAIRPFVNICRDVVSVCDNEGENNESH